VAVSCLYNTFNEQQNCNIKIHAFNDVLLLYRTRRSEARIQQMLWKVGYSDIVFVNTVRIMLLSACDALTKCSFGGYVGIEE